MAENPTEALVNLRKAFETRMEALGLEVMAFGVSVHDDGELSVESAIKITPNALLTEDQREQAKIDDEFSALMSGVAPVDEEADAAIDDLKSLKDDVEGWLDGVTDVMLATSVDETGVVPLVASDEWIAQQKYDGHRTLIRVGPAGVGRTNRVYASSRTGKLVKLPKRVQEAFEEHFPVGHVYDGELLGATFIVFDVVDHSNDWNDRDAWLDWVFAWLEEGGIKTPSVVRAVTARTSAEKARLVKALMANSSEGVMFKRANSTYKAGRSRDWLKFKFIKTCEAEVTELDRGGKAEAFSIGLYDSQGELQEAGGCRLLPQFQGKVKVGDVVEVSYLYATEDKKLFQPVLVRLRPDKHVSECVQSQLKMTDRTILTEGTLSK